MHERNASVADIPIRWLESGDGNAVVFIHGIPTSPSLWRDVVPLLDGRRTLAWEMVGYGGSWQAGAERDISVAAQAGYLIEWLEHLELDRVTLVGHDLGGGVAQIAAVRRPDLFQGLVLINAVCYDSWPIPSVKMLRRIGSVIERTPPPLFRGVFSSFLRRGHDDQKIAGDAISTHWRFYDHASGPAAFVNQIRSLDVRDTLEVAPRLSHLDVPAAVVWGAADRFQKIHYGERLARDLRARLDVIHDGKHFVPEDHPDAVAAAVASVTEKASL